MRLSRRFALTAAAVGALVVSSVALATGGVVGTYTATITKPSQLTGKWTLAFAKGSSYTVKLNGKAVARGRYSATATTITFVHETGSGAALRTPVVKAANRATWVRLAADMIADVRTLPPTGACPSVRAVLEARLEFVTQQGPKHRLVAKPRTGAFGLFHGGS